MNDQERHDLFAAAALTGLLAGRVNMYADVMEDRSDFCGKALRLADAMLAKSGTTDHGAAPPASSPTLTDAERELLEALAVELPDPDSSTLRGLLARAAKECMR